jgi:thioredoxin 1
MTVLEANDTTLDELIGSAELPVLVEFTAKWCPPCRTLAPVLEDLAAEERERLIVAAVDVDVNPEVTNRHGVRAMPTLVLFVDGEACRRVVGARSKSQLRRDLELAPSATR